MGRRIGVVETHGPGWLGRRAIRGTRLEVLMEESVAEGVVTDTEGLGGSLAPMVAEETGARVEDEGRSCADEEGGGEGEDGCEGDVAENNSRTEAPLAPGPVPKATVFSDDPEATVKAWEVRSGPGLPKDAGKRGCVAFTHGEIGDPEEILAASASEGDASGPEWPSLHAVGPEVFHNGHGDLENMEREGSPDWMPCWFRCTSCLQ